MSRKFFLLKNFNNNFVVKKDKKKISKILKEILKENTPTIKSLSNKYENSYKKKQLLDYKKKFNNFRIIGMGGSVLGTQAIYDFLKHKIKKTFKFINNLQNQKNDEKKDFANLVISKSGNTIETIINTNNLIKKNNQNIFITENKKSYLRSLAEKMKSEIVEHNNFIGGRYSVLSEVGMLPAELMGLNVNQFKQLNFIIKDKFFYNSLVNNVASIFNLIKKKKI